jgi:hypothetical protein
MVRGKLLGHLPELRRVGQPEIDGGVETLKNLLFQQII